MKLRNALAAGVAAGLIGGCSAESAPEPIDPDGTYEQVLHNLGGDLGDLTLHQTAFLILVTAR